MTSTTINDVAISRMRRRFRGEIILPQDDSYDDERGLFNSLYDKRPAMIAKCAGTADVVAAVRFARQHGLEVAVRSGGRHMAGFASTDGGVLIDLSLMRGVKVDPDEQTAWFQAGCNGGDLQATTLAHGLGAVTAAGSTTGVGGANLHGGVGWMSARMGWAVDTILEFEIVTADGDILHVSPDEHPELFWAVRGEAANFGVVTWIKQALAPLPDGMLAGYLIYPGEQGPDVLRFLRELNRREIDDLFVMLDIVIGQEEEGVPKELSGKLALVVTVTHTGDPEQAEKDVRPLLEAFPPAAGGLGRVDMLDFMIDLDVDFPPTRQWFDEEQVDDLTDEVIDIAMKLARDCERQQLPGRVIIYPYASKLAAEPKLPSAFPRPRPGGWSVGSMSGWMSADEDAPNSRWATSVADELRAADVVTGVVYGNVQQLQDVERRRRSYGEQDWARLVAVKAKYDPENFFRLNHNIPVGP